MKKILFIAAMICCAVMSINAHRVNLFKIKPSSPDILERTIPTSSVITNRSTVLRVNLDNQSYSNYTINLLSSDSSIDTTFVANSATVNLILTTPALDYVLTIDGGNYGRYEGIFNGDGNDSINLTDVLALKLVKNRRERNTTVNYFMSTVRALINDSISCMIDSLPSEPWATSQQEKCLVFIDENPQLSWGHECSYCYLPRQISSADSLKTLQYIGILPPFGIVPSSVEMNSYYSITDFHTPSIQFRTALQGRSISDHHDSKYIIFGPPQLETGSPSEARSWNECAAMYTILEDKYNVSPDDIYVLMGNEDGTMLEFNGHDFDSIPMPKDLDGDGIDEKIIPSTVYNVTNLFDLLGDESITGHFGQLFVFYAGFSGDVVLNYGYGEYGEEDIQLYFNESGYNNCLLTSDLAEMIYRTDVDFVSSYFDQSLGSYFETFLAQKHVIMGATGLYQSHVAYIAHQQYSNYNAFSYYWLSAAAETYLGTSQHINVDDNSDGLISFDEISHNAHDDFLDYCTTVPDLNTYIGPCNIVSIPPYLKDSLSFDHIPIHSLLKIDKYDNDSTINWDSPDIWIRNQDDGMTYQESEHITLTEGEPVYVYVRVRNLGDSTSTSLDNKVLIYAAPTAECQNNPMNFTQEYVGDSIGEFYVGAIPAGGSAIYCYEWIWDEPTDEYCIDWETLFANSGNMLPVRILALLGDNSDLHHIQNNDPNHPIAGHKLTLKKHVAVEPKKGISFTEPNGVMAPFVGKRCKFTIPLECNGNSPYSIEIIADSIKSTSNLFYGRSRIVLELSSELLNALNNGGSSNSMSGIYGYTNKFRVTADHAGFSNLSLTDNVNLTVYSEVNSIQTSRNDENWYFHIVLKDSTGRIIDGQTVRSFVKHDSSPIAPLALATPTGNNNYSLTETNINVPSSYEWYDTEFNKFSEGKTIVANRNEIGDVAILRVISNSDGSEQYTIATLDGVPGIESASPVPFDDYINVMLTDDAVTGMAIRVVPVINNVNPIEQSINEGTSNAIINTQSLPNGQYVLCLLHNGEVVQSLNIYKAD